MTDLYKVLNVKNTATYDEIKKSYKSLALKHHPDKTGLINDKFKEISHAYSVLGDVEKRELYDTQNIVSEKKFFDIVLELRKFYDDYINSDEEYNDIINLYKTNYGDFNRIMKNVLFENTSDTVVDRIYNIICKAIDDKVIDITYVWAKTTTKEIIKKIKKTLSYERHKAETILSHPEGIKHISITMDEIADRIASKYCPEVVGKNIEYIESMEQIKKRKRYEK